MTQDSPSQSSCREVDTPGWGRSSPPPRRARRKFYPGQLARCERGQKWVVRALQYISWRIRMRMIFSQVCFKSKFCPLSQLTCSCRDGWWLHRSSCRSPGSWCLSEWGCAGRLSASPWPEARHSAVSPRRTRRCWAEAPRPPGSWWGQNCRARWEYSQSPQWWPGCLERGGGGYCSDNSGHTDDLHWTTRELLAESGWPTPLSAVQR